MSRPFCWGIFREQAHSPGREGDDAEILRLTGKHLEAQGFDVKLKSPDEVSAPTDPRPQFVFLMCERLGALRELRDWEAGGVRQVNRPEAVLNTYRERMIARFAQDDVAFIQSRVVSTTEASDGLLPVWVKRADVHNTQDGDVVYAPTERVLRDALAGLAERRIPRAVIQPHITGDLIKFYGIGGGPVAAPPWFRWFYHKEQNIAGHAFDPVRLERLAWAAAGALGLEIYGGDAIATEDGDLVLLDLNAWPSFALYRDEAAACIASYLARRFAGGSR